MQCLLLGHVDPRLAHDARPLLGAELAVAVLVRVVEAVPQLLQLRLLLPLLPHQRRRARAHPDVLRRDEGDSTATRN